MKVTVNEVKNALKEFYINRYVVANFGTKKEIKCEIEFRENKFYITVLKSGHRMFMSSFTEPYITPKGGLTITDLSPKCVMLLGAFYEDKVITT